MFSQAIRRSARDAAPGRSTQPEPEGRRVGNRGSAVPRLSQGRAGRGLPRYLLLVPGACTLLLVSCLNPPLEPQPLTVTLTASQESATVGQEIRFRYESRGTNLSQTVVEYGNGDLETVPFIYTGGAPVNINSQAGHFDYAYEEPGTYVARATVSTVAGDSRSAMVTVRISGP